MCKSSQKKLLLTKLFLEHFCNYNVNLLMAIFKLFQRFIKVIKILRQYKLLDFWKLELKKSNILQLVVGSMNIRVFEFLNIL